MLLCVYYINALGGTMCVERCKMNSSIWRAYQNLEGSCWAAECAFSDCLWCVLLYQVANPLLHLQLLVCCFPYSAIKLEAIRGYSFLKLTLFRDDSIPRSSQAGGNLRYSYCLRTDRFQPSLRLTSWLKHPLTMETVSRGQLTVTVHTSASTQQ